MGVGGARAVSPALAARRTRACCGHEVWSLPSIHLPHLLLVEASRTPLPSLPPPALHPPAPIRVSPAAGQGRRPLAVAQCTLQAAARDARPTGGGGQRGGGPAAHPAGDFGLLPQWRVPPSGDPGAWAPVGGGSPPGERRAPVPEPVPLRHCPARRRSTRPGARADRFCLRCGAGALVAGFMGFLIAQVAKVFTHYYTERKWDLSRLVGSGGMPSSHTALVSGGGACGRMRASTVPCGRA